MASDQVVDEPAVGVEVGEVAGATQQQGILDGLLEMPVRALDRTVLVGDAGIVAAGLHAVVGAQGVIAAGQVVAGAAVEIAEGGREAVAAMLARRAAQGPQGVLQAFGTGVFAQFVLGR